MHIVACYCMLLNVVIQCPYCCMLLHVVVECISCTDSEFPVENIYNTTIVANKWLSYIILLLSWIKTSVRAGWFILTQKVHWKARHPLVVRRFQRFASTSAYLALSSAGWYPSSTRLVHLFIVSAGPSRSFPFVTFRWCSYAMFIGSGCSFVTCPIWSSLVWLEQWT